MGGTSSIATIILKSKNQETILEELPMAEPLEWTVVELPPEETVAFT